MCFGAPFPDRFPHLPSHQSCSITGALVELVCDGLEQRGPLDERSTRQKVKPPVSRSQHLLPSRNGVSSAFDEKLVRLRIDRLHEGVGVSGQAPTAVQGTCLANDRRGGLHQERPVANRAPADALVSASGPPRRSHVPAPDSHPNAGREFNHIDVGLPQYD